MTAIGANVRALVALDSAAFRVAALRACPVCQPPLPHLPKKNLGAYCTMGKGSANMSSSTDATMMPFQRLMTPARMVKTVWEKM